MRMWAQVLILVLVVLLLGGLLAVGVSRVREEAARLNCSNNLKQIGICVESRHDANGHFPAAAMPTPAGLPPQDRLGWLVAILPYIESAPYYKQLDHERGWLDPKNAFLARMPYRYVLCERQGPPPEGDLVPTAYVGIAGLGDDALSLPTWSERAGFFGYERVLTRKHSRALAAPHIEGRADSLLMVVETAQLHGAWTAAGPPTARGVPTDTETYIGTGAPFGGLHRGGANALYADGSVRFLSDATDPDVFRQSALVRQP
jgi:prepilin-type processing-associated H-X9-DG protein